MKITLTSQERLTITWGFVYFVSPPCGKKEKPVFYMFNGCLGTPFDCVKCTPGQAYPVALEVLSLMGRNVIIDVGTQPGRDLLYNILYGKRRIRAKAPNKYNWNERLFLCSLFGKYKERFKTALSREDPGATSRLQHLTEVGLKHISPLINSTPCSLGGLRRLSPGDLIVLRAMRAPAPNQMDYDMIRDLYHHPLCLIPRFLILETNWLAGNRMNPDAKQMEARILQLGLTFAQVMQHPFPIENHPSGFPPEPSIFTEPTEAFKNILFSVFSADPFVRKKVFHKFPHLSRMLQAIYTVTLELHTGLPLVFVKNPMNTYDLIHIILNLILGYWIDSFYEPGENKEPFMDTGVLNKFSRESLKLFIEEEHANTKQFAAGSTGY
jgi:hypothetical protein